MVFLAYLLISVHAVINCILLVAFGCSIFFNEWKRSTMLILLVACVVSIGLFIYCLKNGVYFLG